LKGDFLLTMRSLSLLPVQHSPVK